MEKALWIIILILLISPLSAYGEIEEPINSYTERAIVLGVEEGLAKEHIEDITTETQHVKLKVISGEFKGKIFETENHLSDNLAYDIIVKKGDKIIVAIDELQDGTLEAYVADYARQNYKIGRASCRERV